MEKTPFARLAIVTIFAVTYTYANTEIVVPAEEIDTTKVLQEYVVAEKKHIQPPPRLPSVSVTKPIATEANGAIIETPAELENTAIDTAVPVNTDTAFVEESPSSYYSQQPTYGSPEIALLLNDHVNPILWQGVNNYLRSPAEITHLYARLNYRPLWTQDGVVTPLAEQVIRATLSANQHALRPEVYHTEATSSLKAGQRISEPNKFDVILSDAFVTYKKHLTNGIVDPKSQFDTWNTKPRSIDFLGLYLNATMKNRLGDAFTVEDKDYQILQQAYLNELQNSTVESFTPIPAKSLRVGDTGEAVRVLRARMGLDTNIDAYDDALRAAIRVYQQSNGLGADGIAGRKTIRALNRRPDNRLEKLAINMERYRWGYIPKGTNYIWVNIPAYQMAIKNNNRNIFQSKVIVGRSKRPTPVFSDTLEHVVLAPYWNVPKTIYKEDKLPLLKKNPRALGNSIQVINTQTGKIVNPAKVNWATGGKGYRLRQLPGASNALGRMKFLFPNRHAIYLHDTPSRKLFKRSNRAFSSGCIRVERAEDLAVFLLKDMGYNRNRVKKESRKTREKWVNLTNNKRYPVFLNYYTAWVDNNQQVHYSRDIYGYDKKLARAYKKALKNL